MQNSFNLDARKEWNTDFLSDKSVKKLNLPFGKDYYARMNGNRVVEIYSVDEKEFLIREPLTTLLMLPMTVPVRDGFELYGIHYTQEELRLNEADIIKNENQ
jgi:hypothetical protein